MCSLVRRVPPPGRSYPDPCPLEFFAAGEIDLDAWSDFLDRHLPPEAQDDAHLVRKAWAEFLARRNPREYGDLLADRPTLAPPGSEEKILELARRARLRQRTHHPCDAKTDLD